MILEGFELIGHDCPYGEYPAPVIPVGLLAGNRVVVVYPEGRPEQRVQPAENRIFVEHSPSLSNSLKGFNVMQDRLFAFSKEHVRRYSIHQEEKFLRAFLEDAQYRGCSPGIRNMLARHIGELASV
jgi:hypothetical protein